MPSFGMTNDMIFARQAPELLERYPLEQLSLEKEALYRSIFEESIAPTRGLVDFLKSLKEHGIKIAVGSSGNTNNVNFVLSRCRIAEYFDAIANGDMISHGKPDPEVYLLAAKLLGIKARRVRRNRGCSRRYRGGTPGRNGCRGVGHYFFARPDSRLRYPGRRFHTAWL